MKEAPFNSIRLGLNIRRHRKYIQHLTQAELAEKVGCTAQAISEYEHGKRELSVRMLITLCRALGCTPAGLLQDVA